MSIIVEIVSNPNCQLYKDIADEVNGQLLLKNGYISLGMKQNDQPIGLLIAKVSDDKAVILFMKVYAEQEEQLLSAFMQVLEKVLTRHFVKYFFCFHPHTEKMSHALQLAGWNSDINQYEYTISAKHPQDHKLVPFVQIIAWDKAYVGQLYKKDIFSQEALPPFEVIDPASSYLMVVDDKVAGWFITVKPPESTVLNIARFYIEEEYREVKTAVSFLRNVLYQNYKKKPYNTISFNIVASQMKLLNIIDKGYLGIVKEKKPIMRSYKIVEENWPVLKN